MSREFSKPTRRDALRAAGGKCQAEGTEYGFEAGHRCNADLAYGVEFDHRIPWALSRDSSLSNCLCLCKKCHRYRTEKTDIPQIAKSVRQRDKHLGIKGPKRKIPSRPFSKPKRCLSCGMKMDYTEAIERVMAEDGKK